MSFISAARHGTCRLKLTDDGAQYIVFLHEHYIAHLDVADRNVLYDSETKSLTFIDFELSVVRPTSLPSRLTVWHRTIPKMCQGEWPENTRSRKFDPYAADIWSLGNMLMNEVPEKVSVFCFAHKHPYFSTQCLWCSKKTFQYPVSRLFWWT